MLEVGSSRTRTAGSTISTRAIASIFRSPPLSLLAVRDRMFARAGNQGRERRVDLLLHFAAAPASKTAGSTIETGR
jgi:hypothetical protein